MALQLNKSARGRNLKVAAGTGAVVLGAGYLLISTFPHLKTSIYNYLTNTQEEASDDNEPIELSRSDVQQAEKEEEALSQTVVGDSSLVDINEWSQDNLKHWLSQVCILLYRYLLAITNLFKKEISPPPDATRDGLISYVKSIQEKSG